MALLFSPDKDCGDGRRRIVEGVLLASYQFNKYRSNCQTAGRVEILTLCFARACGRTAALQTLDRSRRRSSSPRFLWRAIWSTSRRRSPPRVFSVNRPERYCRGRGLSVEVWDKRKIEAMKLAGLLAVNRGSHEEPRFIKIHYKPAGKAEKESRADRQRHYFRFGRVVAQTGQVDGNHEARHGRRRRRNRRDELFAQAWISTSRSPATCRRRTICRGTMRRSRATSFVT